MTEKDYPENSTIKGELPGGFSSLLFAVEVKLGCMGSTSGWVTFEMSTKQFTWGLLFLLEIRHVTFRRPVRQT